MLGRADKGAFRAGFRVLQGLRFGEYILLFEQVSHSMDRVCRACASCEACSTLARDRESESEIENEERFRHCRQGGNLNHSRQHTQEETQARAVVRAAVEVVLVETKKQMLPARAILAMLSLPASVAIMFRVQGSQDHGSPWY